MKNTLYNEFSNFYAAMSNDRDFGGQLDYLLNTFSNNHPCRSLLELFAGQSLHGIAAQKKGTINVWAADSSAEMKELALINGFKDPNQYLVGHLPGVITKFNPINKIDCILCLYHGLSNLKIESVHQLFKSLKKVLNKKGKIFVEIHNISKLMEYVEAPHVHKELLQMDANSTIQYAWPSEKIKWSPYSFSAIVPIKVYLSSAAGTKALELFSQDRIYSAEDIQFIAGLLGYKSKILTDEMTDRTPFGHSIILELSFKDENLS